MPLRRLPKGLSAGFYQTYGIRAASRKEAELLLADMRRKEPPSATRWHSSASWRNRNAQRRFEEESRRLGAQVATANQRAEEEAQRQREDEVAARKRRKRRSRRPN